MKPKQREFVKCSTCKGQGFVHGDASKTPCEVCHGQGVFHVVEMEIERSDFEFTFECPHCGESIQLCFD